MPNIRPNQPEPVPTPTAAAVQMVFPATAPKSSNELGVIQSDEFQVADLKRQNLPGVLSFSTLPSQEKYQQAVNSLQSRVQADLNLQDLKQPRDLYLRQNYQPILMTHPQPSPKGTVILFHGYTAGPWQFKEQAEAFFKAGYNVYVPRIPGHGLMKPDGTPTGEKMVDTWNMREYEHFVQEVHDEVKALGGPMQVVGLSGGSNLAIRMGERYDDLKSVIAMAPYLGPDERIRPVSKVMQTLERVSPLKVGRLLDFKNYNQNKKVALDHPMPHTQGTLNNAYAMLNVGVNVDKVKSPMQLITTEQDLLAGTGAVEGLYQRSGGAGKNAWFHYQAKDKVPHAMASRQQNTEPGQVDHLWQMIYKVIDQGELSERLPEKNQDK